MDEARDDDVIRRAGPDRDGGGGAAGGATYCAACGSALLVRRIEGREREVCGDCGRISWRNPVPASAAVVVRGGEVLLVRRGIEPFRGAWTLPAGYQEVEEHPAVTAERETLEETGVQVRAVGLLDVLLTEDDPRKPAILVVYLCEVLSGTPRPADDATEAAFFPIGDLPDPIGFRNNRVVLDRVAREHAAGEIRVRPLDPGARRVPRDGGTSFD